MAFDAVAAFAAEEGLFDVGAGVAAGAGAAEAAGSGAGAAGAVDAGAGTTTGAEVGGAFGGEALGAGTTGTAGATPTGVSVLNASAPTTTLDPQTAEILGVSPNTTTGMLGGTTPSGAEASLTGPAAAPADASLSPPPSGSTLPDPAQAPPPTNEGLNQFTAPQTSTTQPSTMDQVLKAGKAINPQTAALLGISGVQAFSKPKIPEAARTLSGTAGPGAAAASATIQSGGTASPAWATQKQAIDASIDQQIQEQTAALLQQAQNSGQGTDSQVTIQQINKVKNQLEAQRQAAYAQAQQQNVQAALQELGISDQALTGVANAQFTASEQGKQSAAQTAALALQLQALSKNAG